MSRLNERLPVARSVAALALVGALLASCGGGGGGGGGSGSPGTGAADTVAFNGFTFRVGSGAPTSTPPVEDLSAVPPKLGAPLDVTIIFNFSDVPQGPFSQLNLPLYTTPADVTPDAQASPAIPVIPAKGTYVLVGTTVEFRPFVPTEALQLTLSAPADAVPGLEPASTYTVKVNTTPGEKIPNLKGGGGQVQFGTTALAAGYFTGTSSDGLGPHVLSVTPADGTTGFYPGPFSNFAPGSVLPSFPPGDETFTITYDHQLAPTDANLNGQDWDGDGYVDPNFFLRAQATRLLVAQTVPADSSIGNAAAFPALAGLTEGETVPADGDAIFLHNSQGAGALPGADPALSSTPSSIATARDSDLLYVILRVDSGTDLFSVADHALGDPSFADLAASALDTGLDNVVGLTTLQSGRLIGYDSGTHRIHEFIPQVTRTRPVGEPVLTDLALGDGTTGFLGDLFPAGQDVLDLAQSPSGDLYALLAVSGSPFPRLQRLTPIDPELNGLFGPGEGLPDGSAPLLLDDAYAAISFVDPDTLLALNRGTDRIDTLELASGFSGTVVSGVAAYGVPLAKLPGGLSPALDLEVGHMEQDVAVALLANDSTHAVVRLTPRGVLPIGSRIDVMQRNVLSSIQGVSAANEDPDNTLPVLGASRVLTVTTSSPINMVGPCSAPDPDARVNDVLDETFDDTSLEDAQATGISPLAEWAPFVAGGGTTGHLRASVDVGTENFLGDFLPQPLSTFDPLLAYKRPTESKPKPELDANFKFVFFDTDAQNFPMAGGETPGVTENLTVFGGHFTFKDFIIPEGVWVIAKGTHPLHITATGHVEIRGVLDIGGTDGANDTSFNSAFLPVNGGSGGPGAGRGGNGHPTVFPKGAPTQHCVGGFFFAAYATPETGENGYAPSVLPTGQISFQNGGTQAGTTAISGGRGGLSTLGYDPDEFGYPNVKDSGNGSEFHRPPGGGGGTFYFHGMQAHQGTGAYRVQSSSAFGNFTLCPTNNKINDALYGTEELQYCCGTIPQPLQCVYMQGTPNDPEHFQPGGLPGDLVFKDGNRDNDYFGGNGELQVLVGGQGGGGGGSRVDSMKQILWAANQLGAPFLPGPPCYPNLFIGFYVAPTLYDAKGGGGGGGGGSVLIRSFGDILLTRTGHIRANGGEGGGGETVGASNYSGGGGGGSGGAVILQAAGDITVQADANHRSQWYIDDNGAQGAAIDVSGGFGMDAATKDDDVQSQTPPPAYQFTRSDGGQGGFGLIQLQEGSGDGMPTVQQGAFLFARQMATIKRYKQITPTTISPQFEHPAFATANKPPDVLRYIDIHYYRSFDYDASATKHDPWYSLNGADPPFIQVTDPGQIGPFQLDTPMIDYVGKRVVKEPQPEKLLATYNGYDAAFKEIGVDGQLPGTPHLPTDAFPFSVILKQPDGTALTKVIEGVEQFDPDIVVDRLPVISLGKAPPEFGTVSRGTSKWIDFNGVALRLRDANGVAPPLFSAGINGTYNGLLGVPPAGKDGEIITGNPVPGVPGHFVLNTGFPPFDPGLCGNGSPPDPKYNDIKCDSPEYSVENVVTDNASVKLFFQGSFPIRAGSHVPDPATLSEWVSDLRDLSGYPLVRFQVVFDVSVNSTLYPFSVDSLRPAVDEVRMRVRY